MTDPNNIHATTIEIDGQGCLIRGRSGSGKSLLALALLTHYGDKAALVADDQTLLNVVDNQLVATCPAPIRGKIELYGRGIIDWPAKPQTSLKFIFDLVETLPRMPQKSEFVCELRGVTLKRVLLPEHANSDSLHQVMLIEAALFHQS